MPVTAEQQQFAMLMQKEAGNEQVGIVQEALPPLSLMLRLRTRQNIPGLPPGHNLDVNLAR
jgi:hypothetical protein